jgi:hypothetical protein
MPSTLDALRARLHQRHIVRQRLAEASRTVADASATLAAAEAARVRAIQAAHDAGLSVRQIAAAVGLGHSRVQQLLHAPEAR